MVASIEWDLIPRQQFLPEDGEVGDCWRCCVAAVLGRAAENVPHFAMNENGSYNYQSVDDTQRWLNVRGHWLLQADGYYAFGFPYSWTGNGPPPVISCGPTSRSRTMGQHHAVVMIGHEIVYDPHPSGVGLTAVTEQFLIFRLPTRRQ